MQPQRYFCKVVTLCKRVLTLQILGKFNCEKLLITPEETFGGNGGFYFRNPQKITANPKPVTCPVQPKKRRMHS